jgi:hypothetical protein
VATYLVVPVLVARDVDPLEAVKESALLLKSTWGENLIGQAGVGVAFGLIQFGVIASGFALLVLVAMAHSFALVITVIVSTVVAVVLVALVHSALAGIYAAALYRYATTGEGTGGFGSDTLALAFRPK